MRSYDRNLSIRPPRPGARLYSLVVIVLAVGAGDARAVSPQSPEVRKLVADALAFLEKPFTDDYGHHLGGKCLVGLVFLKAEQPNHPRVAEALEACQQALRSNPTEATVDVYSNGLAVIFLCELSPRRYSREIGQYLDLLRSRQKPHGGWGYINNMQGDTSQTQYATLCYWEAHRRGFQIDGDSLEGVTEWIMRTQDPDGCWGYQGNYSETDELIAQNQKGCSMLAAGMGSAYICADLLDGSAAVMATAPTSDEESSLPAAFRRANQRDEEKVRIAPKIRPKRIDERKLMESIERAHGWMDKNYEISIGPKAFYYLYALERYKSFEEASASDWQDEPQWYNDGYEFLVESRLKNSYWAGYCGQTCDTAFAVLFLIRSTQKSIRAGLGEGTLLAGRGIPTNVSKAKLRNGQLVVEQLNTKVEELLSLIDDGEAATLEELARDPGQLLVEKVDKHSARRLQQLVRGGEPGVRLLAVRTLGRSGDLDNVPALLYALTDPDRRIVLEARDGLRFISRQFTGFGPPDDFTDQQRFDAINAWKNWYLSLRPSAVLEP